MSSLMTHYRNAVFIGLGVILLLLWLRNQWASRK
jgi:hypothetical protein